MQPSRSQSPHPQRQSPAAPAPPPKTSHRTHPITLYRDYIGAQFETIEELAGAICPAVEYNFSVSRDTGSTWRKPSLDDREEIPEAVANHPGCCRNI